MAHPVTENETSAKTPLVRVRIAGSGAARGSRRVNSAEVDRAFGMPAGKLRDRAGIETLAYVSVEENELSLAAAAARDALHAAGATAHGLDWIVATSETHHNYPSLSAQLHTQLRARESCAALDVGGGCLGLLNALAMAQSLVVSGQGRTVMVTSADVHSRTLTPGRVAGEFGGLFGDGASAFVLRDARDTEQTAGYVLDEFFFGCLGQYADAVSVTDAKDGGLTLQFDGEALSRAAVTRMEKMISELEVRSGISRKCVRAFATHQPNPRLVALLAKQCGVAPSLFPDVSRSAGNLGSSTCGVALHMALQTAMLAERAARSAIFLASLGPGLVYGAGWATVDRAV